MGGGESGRMDEKEGSLLKLRCDNHFTGQCTFITHGFTGNVPVVWWKRGRRGREGHMWWLLSHTPHPLSLPFIMWSVLLKLADLVTSGYCQPPPPGCPRTIYGLMVQCW